MGFLSGISLIGAATSQGGARKLALEKEIAMEFDCIEDCAKGCKTGAELDTDFSICKDFCLKAVGKLCAKLPGFIQKICRSLANTVCEPLVPVTEPEAPEKEQTC